MKIQRLNLIEEFGNGDKSYYGLWDVVHDYDLEHCNFDQKMLFRIIERIEEKQNEIIDKLNKLK